MNHRASGLETDKAINGFMQHHAEMGESVHLTIELGRHPLRENRAWRLAKYS